VLRKISLLLAVMAIAFTTTVVAEPPAKVMDLLNQAKVANGYMDKQMHDDFWVEVRKSVEPDPSGEKLKDVESSLSEYILKSAAFPLEGWRSAKLSLEQKKVVRTPELVRQTQALKAQNIPGLISAIESTDKMLEAAATGKPLTSNGRTVYINEEMISQVLDGMDASFSRLKVLTNPVWTDELFEQSIPKMKLSVLTHEKFAVSALKDSNVPSYMAARNANTLQEQLATISFASKPDVDLDATLRNTFNAAATSSGLKEPALPTKWRGMDGLTSQGKVELEGKTLGMAIQVVKTKSRSLLLVMTITDGSGNDASLALDDLLKRIKLKP
jgi:hypothetical protein